MPGHRAQNESAQPCKSKFSIYVMVIFASMALVFNSSYSRSLYGCRICYLLGRYDFISVQKALKSDDAYVRYLAARDCDFGDETDERKKALKRQIKAQSSQA